MTSVVEKLPPIIRVGPYDFQIDQWTPMQAAAAHRYGECSSAELRISISLVISSGTKAVDTFLHEVGHAIWWAYGLEDEDKEERVVGIQSTAWTQVYRDNPWLLTWLGECLHG